MNIDEGEGARLQVVPVHGPTVEESSKKRATSQIEQNPGRREMSEVERDLGRRLRVVLPSSEPKGVPNADEEMDDEFYE